MSLIQNSRAMYVVGLNTNVGVWSRIELLLLGRRPDTNRRTEGQHQLEKDSTIRTLACRERILINSKRRSDGNRESNNEGIVKLEGSVTRRNTPVKARVVSEKG